MSQTVEGWLVDWHCTGEKWEHVPDRCPAELPVGLYRTCEVYRTLQRRDMDIDNRDDCKLTDVTYTTRFTQCII